MSQSNLTNYKQQIERVKQEYKRGDINQATAIGALDRRLNRIYNLDNLTPNEQDILVSFLEQSKTWIQNNSKV